LIILSPFQLKTVYSEKDEQKAHHKDLNNSLRKVNYGRPRKKVGWEDYTLLWKNRSGRG
jgi:hypothetical protein